VSKGWRKTVNITTPSGEKLEITAGEGPMFDESESSGSESESESKSVDESLESEADPLSAIEFNPESLVESSHSSPNNSGEVAADLAFLDVLANEFNKMSTFAYDACHSPSLDQYCFANDKNDKETIKAMEEHENKTTVIEDTETINISNDTTVKEVKIGLTLSQDERKGLINLLSEFVDVFSLSYQDMPGIDRDIAQHTIPLIPGMKLVKQKPRRMKPDVDLKIKEEIRKHLAAGFIKVSKYQEWIANVVLDPKKDGRVRMCVDYR